MSPILKTYPNQYPSQILPWVTYIGASIRSAIELNSSKSPFMYFSFSIGLICATVLSVPTVSNSTSVCEANIDIGSLVTSSKKELSRLRFCPEILNGDLSQIFSSDPSKTQTNLDSVSEILMFFLKQRPFDVVNFKDQARKLQTQLLEIRLSPLVRTSDSFFKQLNFAAGVLQTLADFIRTLSLYETSQDIRYTLIKKVIHTHILVLSLHNVYGELDLDYFRYKNDIRSLQDFLKVLETHFLKSELPLTMENQFNFRLAELRRILHLLVLQIPENSPRNGTGNREYIYNV